MGQRAELVALMVHGRIPVTELSALFGVSRKTAYKWRARYAAAGLAGLADASRRPQTHPAAMSAAVRAALVALRARYPQFGPKKLRHVFATEHGAATAPAASTIGTLLRRLGLTQPARRRRHRTVEPQPAPSLAPTPNATWTADFKGEFRLGDRTYCFPLTVLDHCSRYLLRAQGLRGTGYPGARPVFDSAFREFGLPQCIRTDSGVPFCGNGPAGLTRMTVWWLKLGIRHERIPPGHPEHNGRHERMHRTLKAYVARPPARTLAAQQRALDRFRRHFNDERPHEALHMATPTSLYRPSPRRYDPQIGTADPSYPGHVERRRVEAKGYVRWRGGHVFVSTALASELVGLEEIADGVWRLTFGSALLGHLVENDAHISGLVRPRKQHGPIVLPMSPV
ncbi:MAG TPA: integrase core domain-containing protein [Candidatus Nitrosopolaris sp.]|nr:integrase core domain-containing protein [Candidatus Nitrosopolaris sp.]